MKTTSLYLLSLIALAVAPLRAQSSQPVYWSAIKPNCTSLGEEAPVSITDSSGNVLGYSCFVSGTFVWLAAGGIWGTTIRVSAPASGAVGLEYGFYSTTGSGQSLDATVDGIPRSLQSGNGLAFSLLANQPVEVELLGATDDTPSYGVTAEGSMYVVFFCPDAITCSHVQPQLLYSALPTYPWSLSVPITWDSEVSSQWSAVAVDNGSTDVVGLVVYNEDVTPTSYTVDVYDSTGTLAGSATTPTLAAFLPNSGEGGTYSTLLSSLISPLPKGPFKILVSGGSALCAVEVLQISGNSATTLQVAPDSAPRSTAIALKPLRPSVKRLSVTSTPHVVSGPWRK